MLRLPLARILIPFASGIWLADRLDLEPGSALAVLALALGLLAILCSRTGRLLAEALLGLSIGALALSLRLQTPSPELASGPRGLTFLEAGARSGTLCRVLVQLHPPGGGRALLRGPERICSWLPGRRALAKLRLEPFRPPSNPGQPDRARRWARRGTQLRASVVEDLILPIAPGPSGPRATLVRLRRVLARGLDPPGTLSSEGALLRAVVLGDREGFPQGLRQSFVRSGTAHLLAVSGLHVGWVFFVLRAGLSVLLRWLPGVALARGLPPGIQIAAVAGACAYAALTGLGVPALRATCMAMAGVVAVLGGRPAPAWNVLALACVVVLAAEPAALFELSFVLSFSAVAGILAWSPRSGAGPLARLVHVTLGAGLATAPLIAMMGAPLSPVALPANLVVVPFFGAIVVPFGLLSSFIGALWPVAAELWTGLARELAGLGIWLVERFSDIDLLRFEVPSPGLTWLLSATAFGLRLAARRQLAWALALPAAAAGLALGAWALLAPAREPSRPSLWMLDVGQGDAMLVRGNEGSWLIDTGGSFGSFDAGRHIVGPALRALGIGRLDVLVLTHADRDHIGGARSILERFEVAELWMTRDSFRAPAMLPIRATAAQRGVPVRWVSRGDAADWAPFRLRVLWPPAGESTRSSNAGSIVLRLDGLYSDDSDGREGRARRCVMLPGDAPLWVESELAEHLGPCAVLKLGHHGSRTSTGRPWLRALRPRLALVSAGHRRRSPLPHSEVRRRLREGNITLYETRRSGAVHLGFEPDLWVTPYLLNSD